MPEPESSKLTSEQQAVREDIVRQTGLNPECLEILTIPLTAWPEGISAYYLVRKDRHGRIFYNYVCFDGEVYSPFTPDGLDRLLVRLLSSRRFTLTGEQLANILLMYKRPEPLMTLITDFKQDIALSSQEALDMYYDLSDFTPQLTKLEEDHKLVFWTLNIRWELLKRWTAYITAEGRVRLIEDIKINLRDARAGQETI